MESGCFDLKSGHFCQKVVGESNSKIDFALMFAKCFPLLFFCKVLFSARKWTELGISLNNHRDQ